MVYGIDLIREQINMAAGANLSFSHDLATNGHSIECRINAEDAKTFIPSPGKIDFLVFPGGTGIRVDTAAYCGWNIPPDYDSLIAKIVAAAPNRMEAIAKMRTALEMTTVVGIKTNIPLHLELLTNSEFIKGNYDIQFMDRYLSKGQNQDTKN
jgi:acetyl-CoA carboxylase biotin carboxylase subunit